MKKERERKPILPFHQRPEIIKIRNINPVSKGLSTFNLTTDVADQNRQPNSQAQNDANSNKSTDSTDGFRTKPKPTVPFMSGNFINNNNIDETFFKATPPVPTRLSEVIRSCYDRKKSRTKEDVYSGSKLRKSTPWECYETFIGDPKLKPRLPDDVLDFREGERLPLTTESVVSMPENSQEVFKIETIENKK